MGAGVFSSSWYGLWPSADFGKIRAAEKIKDGSLAGDRSNWYVICNAALLTDQEHDCLGAGQPEVCGVLPCAGPRVPRHHFAWQ